MNLQPVSTGANQVWLGCLRCRKVKLSGRMFADLDGDPFVDYYCDECVEWTRYAKVDDFSDVKRPEPPKPKGETPIHDPWGLSRLG